MSEELKALASVEDLSESITVSSRQTAQDGREITTKDRHTIRPFTYRKLFKVLDHFNNIFAAIGSIESIDLNDTMALFKLVMSVSAKAGEDVQAITALAINKDVNYLDTLQYDDGIALTVKVAQVNKDFFVNKILPMLTAYKAEVVEAQASGQAS